MAGFSPVRQGDQVRNSDNYDDTLTAGATLVSSAETIEDDLNAIRSQTKRGLGTTNWTDNPSNSVEGLHSQRFSVLKKLDGVGSNFGFTLGSPASGVLLDDSMFPGSPILAVGGSSNSFGGYRVAQEANFTTAGILGVGNTTLQDSAGAYLNKVELIDSSGDNPEDGTDKVFALMQTTQTGSDGAAIGGSSSENTQLSFVKQATDGTLSAATIPAGTYKFLPPTMVRLGELPEGAFIENGLLEFPSTVQSLQRSPHREFQVVNNASPGNPIAADVALTIDNITFVTGGAQTSLNTFGTPSLPANGADFINDIRIAIYKNGKRMVKGPDSGTKRDVYRVSATQLAFANPIEEGDVITIIAPASY